MRLITNEEISAEIRARRIRLGLSQAGIAKKLSQMGLGKISRDIIKDSELSRQRVDAVVLENIRLLSRATRKAKKEAKN